MKFIPMAAMLLGTCAVAGVLLAANAQDKLAKPDSDKKEVVFAAADQAKYKDVAPGASMAAIWGDPDKGAHGAFTKFAPGASFAMHTHTSDMHIVVIKGAYVFKPEKGEERRVAAGSFLLVPGGTKHTSGGDAKEGALFYEESTGKFDLNFVTAQKK